MRPIPLGPLVHTLDPPAPSILKREERTLVWREEGADAVQRVVKLYRRRGWWAAVRSGPLGCRAARECSRLRHLTRWGVPCTPPLGWACGRSPDHGYHEVVVMREIPHAVQLGAYLSGGGDPAVVGPLFGTVRRMHESGFCNQTLYVTNILVDPEAPVEARCFLADVPRSFVFPGSIIGTAMALFDLLDLVIGLEEVGVDAERLGLPAYGLDEPSRAWWARERSRDLDPRSKRRRAVRDAVARLRWATAWAWPGSWIAPLTRPR